MKPWRPIFQRGAAIALTAILVLVGFAETAYCDSRDAKFSVIHRASSLGVIVQVLERTTRDYKPLGMVLGGAIKGEVHSQGEIGPLVSGEEKYSLYSLAGLVGTGRGSKASRGQFGGLQYWIRGYDFQMPDPKVQVIAISGDWDAMPRIPQVISNQQPSHIEAVKKALAENGMSSEPKITQIFSVDLDCDGLEDVIISANRPKKAGFIVADARPGDYALVMVCKRQHGKILSHILHGAFFPKDGAVMSGLSAAKVVGVVDLNGDGRMAVIVRSRAWVGSQGHEWNDYSAYRAREGTFKRILNAADGM